MSGSGRRLGRFWSARRVPAGLTALVLLGALGLFLYDIVSARTGHPVMEWRRWLADQLATRPLDDGWIVGIAVALIVLGAWMVLLAVTPGLRGLLPMRDDENASVRAGIDRTAAGLVLRDRAMAVPGVRAVRVAVELGYPSDIGAQCGAVRRHVATRVGELTGMEVPDVAVTVERLHSPRLDRGTVR